MRILLFFILLIASPALSATYYVDFDAGSDSANGTSTSTPWEHSPGDENATGNADITLSAGDTVIFKGGVLYKGSVVVESSGTNGNPITYDGNTLGTFGTGMAIIDGSEDVTGWTACPSAAACGDNALWASMYTATIPSDTVAIDANMFENDEILWPAQSPNLTDEFYFDDTSTFHDIYSDNVTQTTVTDTTILTSSDSTYYDGSYIRLWGNPNRVRNLAIDSFDPANDKITFADTGSTSLYTDRTVHYAIANHILDIDVRGEFSINETTDTIYLYPINSGDPDLQTVTVSVRTKGINIEGHSYITVQGMTLQKHTAGDNQFYLGCGVVDRLGGSNITIQDNTIRWNYSFEREGGILLRAGGYNILVDNNTIYENSHNKGMLVIVHDSVVSNNDISKSGGTAIDLYSSTGSEVINNYVYNNTGGHANGITLYLSCDDVFVGYNKVVDGGIALTLQDATNITVAYNIFQTDADTKTIANWSKSTRLSDRLYFYNNVILNDYGSGLFVGSGSTNVYAINNIMDGLSTPVAVTESYNIYTSLGHDQAAKYGWELQEGEQLVEDETTIFTNYAGGDYTLKSSSPAINAGIAVGQSEDYLGNFVPFDTYVDIGAYEYDSETVDPPDPETEKTKGAGWTLTGGTIK